MTGKPNFSTDFESLPVKYWESAKECAIKEAAYKNLDEFKKTFLSEAKNEILFDRIGEKVTEAQLERLAYSSDKYKNHITGLSKAREEYLMAQAMLDSVNIKVDCMRSENSRYVAEMNLK